MARSALIRIVLATAMALVVLVPAIAVPTFAGPARAPEAPNVIVAFTTRTVDTALLLSLGTTLFETSPSLGLAAVHTSDPARLAAKLSAHAHVAWVDANSPVERTSTSGSASGWDASGWDASGWDASGWDASSWDASSWDASGWDASGWDASSWDASSWDASGWDASTGMTSLSITSPATSTSLSIDSTSGTTAKGKGHGKGGAARAATQETTTTTVSITNDRHYASQWSFGAANASYRTSFAGTGATRICVIDSGVDATHPDLVGRVLAGYDFVDSDADPSDRSGHGTHVAGIAAAVAGNGVGIAGLSAAKIVPVRVLNANGVGQEIDLALGIEYCRAQGAKVISMSLGTPENSKAVHRAVVDAFGAGVVMVASVGNKGPSCKCVQYPAGYPQVVSVGAIRADGRPAHFSSSSDILDFVAPGENILSTVPGGRYATMSGTSQATPMVAALAALLIDRGYTGGQATWIMTKTARDLGPEGKDPQTGRGLIDFGAALSWRGK